MTSEEILASLTAHYVVTERLTPSQWQEHKRRGSCPACERGMPAPELTHASKEGTPAP